MGNLSRSPLGDKCHFKLNVFCLKLGNNLGLITLSTGRDIIHELLQRVYLTFYILVVVIKFTANIILKTNNISTSHHLYGIQFLIPAVVFEPRIYDPGSAFVNKIAFSRFNGKKSRDITQSSDK